MSYTLRDLFNEARVDADQIPEWFGEINVRHPDVEEFRPRWNQVLGLNLGMVYERAAMLDEQGTGKTLPAQAWAIWHGAMGNRVVAMMPPILLYQFEKAFHATFEGLKNHLTIQTYYGTPSERNAMATEWLSAPKVHGAAPHIVLTTPDLFRKEFAIFQQLDFCALMCDECKYWANPESKIYMAIEEFLGPPGERALLGMNGTPAKNTLADLYGYIRLLTPGVYKSRLHFYNEHVDLKEITTKYRKRGELVEQKVKVIDRFRNVPELRANMMRHARRVEKKDVLEIPDKQIIEVDIRLSAAHAKRYRQFAVAKVIEFSDGTAISGEQTATMRQVCMQSVIDTSILQVNEPSAVLELIDELLDEIDVTRNKVYIAAYYNRSIEIICERLKEHNPAMIYGPGASKNKKEIQRFLEDPKCRVAVVNYQSGGVGLNLQGVCHTGIAAEPISVPGDFDQWTDRMHRSGQKNKVTIYSIGVPGTIWVKTQQSMLKKRDWNEQVVSSTQLKKELLGE